MTTLNCEFEILSFSNGESFYTCVIQNQLIRHKSELIIRGNHISGKSHGNVDNVFIRNSTVERVPKGFAKVFPNLKVLEIANSKLKEIVKDDLIEYKYLEKFSCYKNQVSYLPGNLFEDFKNLHWIEFFNNIPSIIIEPSILDGLSKLKYVEFWRETPQDKRFSMYPILSSNASLQDMKDELQARYPSILNDVQEIKESRNQLIEENQKLKNELEKFQSQTELFDEIKRYMQKDVHKDLKITIGLQEFRVHKFILAARSPTLAEIFLKTPNADNLNLVDISPATFKQILKYIYTDEAPQKTETNFMDLFAAAGRLQIKTLQNFAATQISTKINSGNVLDIFELSIKYGDNSLKQKAFDELKKKYPNIKLSQELLLQPDKMKKIIETLKKKEKEMQRLEIELETLVMED